MYPKPSKPVLATLRPNNKRADDRTSGTCKRFQGCGYLRILGLGCYVSSEVCSQRKQEWSASFFSPTPFRPPAHAMTKPCGRYDVRAMLVGSTKHPSSQSLNPQVLLPRKARNLSTRNLGPGSQPRHINPKAKCPSALRPSSLGFARLRGRGSFS